MSIRQTIAAWIAGKPKEPMTPMQTKIVVLTGKQRTAYQQMTKYRAAHGLPVPTIEQYAAHISGGESVYLKTKTRKSKP